MECPNCGEIIDIESGISGGTKTAAAGLLEEMCEAISTTAVRKTKSPSCSTIGISSS
jgi:hypothetical protein